MIQVTCSGCEKRLRVPDTAAGKKARCPACKTVIEIPAQQAGTPQQQPAESPFQSTPIAGGPPAPEAAPTNPFASPQTGSQPSAQSTGSVDPSATIRPSQIDVGEVISTSWEIFKVDWGTLVGAVFIAGLIGYILPIGVGAIFGYLLKILFGIPMAETIMINTCRLIAAVISLYLSMGLINLSLNVARGRPHSLADIFQNRGNFPVAIVATLSFSIICSIGMIFCIVPGVIASLMFGQYLYLIVDRNADTSESLSLSNRITSGNKLHIFLLSLCASAFASLGILALCVGVLWAYGFTLLMFTVAYLRMTGQPTKLDQAVE